MRLFDLHCDTLYRIFTEKVDADSSKLSVTPNMSKVFDEYRQLMAVWVPDNIKGERAFDFFKNCASIFKERYKPLNNSNREYILSVENGRVIGGDVKKIPFLKDFGVVAVTIVYNEDNELGSGCTTSSKFGLTETGRVAVKVFEENGIYVDLSHSSERTFFDVIHMSTKPVIATHSNSRKLCNHCRNLSDEQFLAIVKNKGIVGVNFFPPFLRDDNKKSELDDVIKHIEHFLSLGGENCVCIGSDFDGCEPISELKSLNKVADLYERLLKLNYNEQLVQKIFYYNAHNFFT